MGHGSADCWGLYCTSTFSPSITFCGPWIHWLLGTVPPHSHPPSRSVGHGSTGCWGLYLHILTLHHVLWAIDPLTAGDCTSTFSPSITFCGPWIHWLLGTVPPHSHPPSRSVGHGSAGCWGLYLHILTHHDVLWAMDPLAAGDCTSTFSPSITFCGPWIRWLLGTVPPHSHPPSRSVGHRSTGCWGLDC